MCIRDRTSTTATTYPRLRSRYSATSTARSPPTSTNPRMPKIGGSTELHSRIDPHGLTASDIGDASLRPMAFAANARQTYSTPFVRLPICAVVLSADVTSTPPGHVPPLSPEHS